MKIIHCYVEEAKGWEYCRRTFEAVEKVRDKFGIVSIITPSSDPYSYWKAIKEVWGKDDLIIIEQDIIFTEEQLRELIECQYEDCTYAYILYPISTALPYEIWSIGENLLPERVRLCLLSEKPEYCNFSATGFIKLSMETQRKITLDKPIHWLYTDLEITGRIPDLKLHVHYQVEHGDKYR